jgi:B9 domain-containing protein 2
MADASQPGNDAKWRRTDLSLAGDEKAGDEAGPEASESPTADRRAATPSRSASAGPASSVNMRTAFGRSLKVEAGWKPSGGGSVLKSVEYQLAEAAAMSRAYAQPQVHIIGEIVGGSGFPPGVTCKWAIEAGAEGTTWSKSEGLDHGQTQTDYPAGVDDDVVWSHPIDVHYAAGGLKGWPRLTLEVWRVDDHGRLELSGYGFAHIPATPGTYTLSIPTWRPMGTALEEMSSFFMGGVPRLARSSYVYSRRSERAGFPTVASGTVIVDIGVLTQNFELHGVDIR